MEDGVEGSVLCSVQGNPPGLIPQGSIPDTRAREMIPEVVGLDLRSPRGKRSSSVSMGPKLPVHSVYYECLPGPVYPQ